MTKPPLHLTVDKSPCKSCPYRKDVPSGVWDASEYKKLLDYDDPIEAPGLDRIMARLKRFDCHQRNGKLCAGWVGCHGAQNLVAINMAMSMGATVDPKLWDYKSPVPLWESGKAAHDHGMKKIMRPLKAAKDMIGRLMKKRERNPEAWDEGKDTKDTDRAAPARRRRSVQRDRS